MMIILKLGSGLGIPLYFFLYNGKTNQNRNAKKKKFLTKFKPKSRVRMKAKIINDWMITWHDRGFKHRLLSSSVYLHFDFYLWVLTYPGTGYVFGFWQRTPEKHHHHTSHRPVLEFWFCRCWTVWFYKPAVCHLYKKYMI